MPQFAGIAFFNGRITTLDRSQPEAEALVVRRSVAVAIGSTAEVMQRACHGKQRIDLRGYRVRAAAFLAPLSGFARERLRDGAYQWGVYEDAAESGRFIESFLVPSWLEHQRQHHRVSRDDEVLQARVREFHLGPEAPCLQHFVAPATSAGAKR